MHLPEFVLLVLATIAAISAGLAMLASRFSIARVGFGIAALSFGSLGVMWSATSEGYSLRTQMLVAATIAAIAAAAFVWILSEVSQKEKTEQPAARVAVADIEVRFESRAPYEATEISGQGRILSTVKIGLKAIGQSLSNCKVYVEKIAPEPPIVGGLPFLLDGSDFILRHDDPQNLFAIATHWNHVDKFRFNSPGGFWAESYNFLDDKERLTVELKITANKTDGSDFQKTALFELWTDESRKLHMKRIQ